jgi:hypothetical protein
VWDVDTSLFLRTVAIPETLNGENQWEPGLERCLCVVEVLTLQGKNGRVVILYSLSDECCLNLLQVMC